MNKREERLHSKSALTKGFVHQLIEGFREEEIKVMNKNYVSREEAAKIDENYKQILDTETHHDHKIVQDKHGVLRWESDKFVNSLVNTVGMNAIIYELMAQRIDKNHDLWRELYRKIGYSLNGYWEIFYWDMNNEDADDYNPGR